MEDKPPPENLITNQTIARFLKNASKQGYEYFHPNWPKDLWLKPYRKIIEYLGQRLALTEDSHEYYGILPYLVGHIHNFPKFSKRKKKNIAVDPETFKTKTYTKKKFRNL